MITVATGNNKKFGQMEAALKEFGLEARQQAVEIEEIQDMHVDVVVRDKILKSFEAVGEPIIVDDTGIYFDDYPMFPGTYSKDMWPALGVEGMFKLVSEGSRAYFLCAVAYMDAELEEPQVFKAKYWGTVREGLEIDLEDKLPYAQFFIPDGFDQPLSTIPVTEQKENHRYMALKLFAQWYKENR